MSIRLSHAGGLLLQQAVHYLIVDVCACVRLSLFELLGGSVTLISLSEHVCTCVSLCVCVQAFLTIHV